MTRIHHSRAAAAASSSSSHHAMARKKKPYKIVLESVTEEKKKLRSTVSYSAEAPAGYTFVPAGIPELSEFCKELCRKRGLVVHVVSAAPKSKAHVDPEKISHHIHRIGHHFPNDVVDLACDWLGYTTRNGVYEKNADIAQTSRIAKALERHRKKPKSGEASNSEQETQEQVTAAIRDLFPKIPDNDLKAIVKHAFREGTGRVGNAAGLSLPRRVQLAVVAHIRHVYTDYDNLLKMGSYLEARAKVEPQCLERLVKWRGEEIDADKEVELEDTFREFIVIDDSDDGSETGSSSGDADERFPSVEITTTQMTATELQPENYAPFYHDAARSSYRPGRRSIFVHYPMTFPIMRTYPASTPMSSAIREVNPLPQPYSMRPEPALGAYIAPNSGRFAHEMERPTVMYSVPAHDLYRLQTAGYDPSRPMYRAYEQPTYLRDSHHRAYAYVDNPAAPGRYAEESPYAFSTREHPSPRRWRELGRNDEHYALTQQENVPLRAPHRRYEHPREPAPLDRETVLPSIEETENTDPLRALQATRLPSPPHAVPPFAQSSAGYENHAGSRAKQPANYNAPAIPMSNGHGQSHYPYQFDTATVPTESMRRPLSSPFEELAIAGEDEARRPRAAFHRSGLVPREHDALYNRSTHAGQMTHAAFTRPHELVDLASSQRAHQEDRPHRPYIDGGHRRTISLPESHLTRLGEPMTGATEQSFAEASRRSGNINPAYRPANSQRMGNDEGMVARAPEGWYGPRDHLEHSSAISKGPEAPGHSLHTESHSHPSVRMEGRNSRNSGIQANLNRLSPTSKPQDEPIVIDDSPPRKKRRQGTDSKPKPTHAANRQAPNSNNRTAPRHRPVDLDDPQHLSRKAMGHSRGGRSGAHSDPDQLCDLY